MDQSHVKPDKKMNSEDMEFNYFKMHDYDNNLKLDGLEIAKSLMDHHKGEKGNYLAAHYLQ